MTANIYIETLEKELYMLNTKERQAIVRDFQNYFCDLLKEGQSEQETIVSLGAPSYIARELLKAYSEEEMIVVEVRYDSAYV
ncbi:DUF1700 domain-containing protein [Psychrobacillus sp. FSL W7-1457]|uniref:DUF1700 domain-containing protein n=1 Tax=unclassified Psychrobacillus TaxID=2636677 RepID=UPI0030FC2CE2